MSPELQLIESITDEVDEQCPMCGHLWTAQSESHYHDCPFFISELEEDDEMLCAEFSAMHIENIGVMV